ncbi:SDR family oxidoreductase [Acidaminobacter sp. JC074]|uniref:SDR family oxidoreductase n=1 Tax=Acidaminobacter sp. JC074 TaxID=2530199 RepID=UPI001F0D683B|nr:SDR family oxidoreductase [Acidaminobacter sp. JC074]MCH4887101.1 SDR family oxidoreductase [Acidaminobacter sp. JC074]
MDKKVIVITGASSGIGKATAMYFAEKGWQVAATMRNIQAGKELTEFENIKLFELDVTKQTTIDQAYEEILKTYGRIDVLLNNAGYALSGPFEYYTEEQFQRQFDVNVFGVFRTTQTFVKHFRENKKGILMFVTSMGGKITFPVVSTYHSTKYAVEGFAESLSYEVNEFNTSIKIIEPGTINTDFGGRSMDFASVDENNPYMPYISHFSHMTSENTGIDPVNVAEVIYQAATDNSSQMRYTVGEDAEQLIGYRQESGDEAYVKMMTDRFKLQ